MCESIVTVVFFIFGMASWVWQNDFHKSTEQRIEILLCQRGEEGGFSPRGRIDLVV